MINIYSFIFAFITYPLLPVHSIYSKTNYFDLMALNEIFSGRDQAREKIIYSLVGLYLHNIYTYISFYTYDIASSA